MSTIKTPELRIYDLNLSKPKGSGDISSAFASFGDSEVTSLPEKYSKIKKDLVKDADALTASWVRLKRALHEEVEKIKIHGTETIPSIEFSDIHRLSEKKREEILKSGTFVVKNVIQKEEAMDLKSDLQEYVKTNPNTSGFPKEDPVVFEIYWSKSQLRARSHSKLRAATRFANKLWHASSETEVCLDQNISYADRLSMRWPGETQFSLGAHADGGSLERWEDIEYSKCYEPIFQGSWENYDPYDATHRIGVDMNLHDSIGNCSIFRTFQAFLSLSETEPYKGGMKFAPSVKAVTAYYMLKPYFDEHDNLRLDSRINGAFPGKGLEFSNETHPELDLEALMVPPPKIEPGDMVFWHCDLIHLVDPVHTGSQDTSVLYIPSAPLCNLNVDYGFRQREAFIKGLAGPDFPGFPHGIAETQHKDRGTPREIEEYGGREAMKEFALEKFDEKEEYSEGAKRAIQSANKLLFY